VGGTFQQAGKHHEEVQTKKVEDMAIKTKLNVEDGRQEILITREFELPVELLYQAHVDPEVVEQWMGTKVVKLENRKHGGWEFETSDGQGNVVLRMHGVIHDVVPDQKIVRTFEMADTPFPVQLEFLEFEKLTDETSKLNILIVYKSVADRDQMLKLPFAQGINMAHNRLQEVVSKRK
jgi:uncharacterized protein YndB with AHSA1/START domain